ncbi:CLUMA_CG005678, isoform A [Clunio marinus]|uniref:CLUMA_CG005678, isoform A n=1 Tax=Clunio marinus TaxID=568069 RepID=A0A1J1HVT9_9DIPT|nr:CLUMA_CG005678, isoform A [Clunio marinus]
MLSFIFQCQFMLNVFFKLSVCGKSAMIQACNSNNKKDLFEISEKLPNILRSPLKYQNFQHVKTLKA